MKKLYKFIGFATPQDENSFYGMLFFDEKLKKVSQVTIQSMTLSEAPKFLNKVLPNLEKELSNNKEKSLYLETTPDDPDLGPTDRLRVTGVIKFFPHSVT